MSAAPHAFTGGFRAELKQLKRSPLPITLVVIQAITFIFLVNFFGMTGAFAPTALIDNDNGYYSKMFVENLENAHQAFNLKFMDEKSALNAIGQGKLVAIITIPKGFSDSIALGKTVPINVVVDNIDTDMTADIQRALPSAITTFAKVLKSPDIHVQTAETDLIDHDTGFIPYLVVSALALSALIISGILGAITVAREFESKTFEVIRVSPTNPVIPILGRVLATNIVSVFALLLAVSIVIWGHGIIPSHPVELTLVLLLCIVVFGWIGAALGAALKKTLPSVSLIFGISLPLYLFSGTYEPQRFDGNLTWTIAHFTPLYYVVGILEHSVLDLKVTPESVGVNFLIVAGWGILALGVMYHFIQRTTTSLLTVSPAISTGELESPSRSLKARLSGQNPILNRLKATSRASARGSISWHQWRRSKLYKSFRWVEDIWIITKLDLLMWRRTPLAVASALIPPIGMALILVALSLAVVQQPVALVVLGNGQYSQKMQEIIQSDTDAYVNYDFSPDLKPTDEQTAKNLLDSQQIVAIITIPSDFDEKVENRTAKVDLLLNNVDIDFADDIRRSVDRSVAHFDAPILSSNDAEEAGQSFDLSQQNPYRIMIDEHDLRETNVEWLDYQVLPVLVLLVLSVGLIGTALFCAQDVERKTARYLLVSPQRAWTLIAGRLLGGVIASMVALIPAVFLCVVTGIISPTPDHWVALIAIFLATAVCAAGLGTIIGTILRGSRTIAMASSVVAIYMFFLGGGFTTIAFLPEWMQTLSKFIPMRYAIDAMRQALFYPTLDGVSKDLLVLSITALFAIILGSYTVRRSWNN